MNLEDQFISEALKEDVREGDHTSLACIPSDKSCKAEIIARENGIIAGIEIMREVFRTIDSEIKIDSTIDDGDPVEKNDMVLLIEGKAQSILKGERLALNFMQRMSGIATLTSKFVKAVEGYPVKILDTRKTTPLFRKYEKMAVKLGGGENHRFGLFDMIMIKDNHIAYAGGIREAIMAAKYYLNKNKINIPLEIEADTLFQVQEIIEVGGVNRIMLDNFSPGEVKKAVKLINRKFEVEISGGITLDTIRKYADCGADFISVGALTHSAQSMDLSLQAL